MRRQDGSGLPFLLVVPYILGQEYRVAIAITRVGRRVNARDNGAHVHHGLIRVAKMVTGADMPCSGHAGITAGAQVVGQRPGLGRLLNHFGRRHAIDSHDVVIDAQQIVGTGRLAIDQAIPLDCRLFSVAFALYDDPGIFGPARRFFLRVGP